MAGQARAGARPQHLTHPTLRLVQYRQNCGGTGKASSKLEAARSGLGQPGAAGAALTSRMMRSRNFSRYCCPMDCSSSTKGTCSAGGG